MLPGLEALVVALLSLPNQLSFLLNANKCLFIVK